MPGADPFPERQDGRVARWRRLRRAAALVFAGERRVWRTAALAALPFLALVSYECLRPRDYFTGTNSVETYTYIAESPAGAQLCVPGLEIPAHTRRLQLQVVSRTTLRPAMRLVLRSEGPLARAIESRIAAVPVPLSRASDAIFAIPKLAIAGGEQPASICITASDRVNWGGTPLPAAPPRAAPTLDGRPVAGRISVWYLPAAGSRQSYLSRTGAIFHRAALFRPGFIGPWLYVLIVFVVLPALALASLRCVAVAAGGTRRRLAVALYVIAAVNFACWSLITPPFQAPDEVDHFAYTQSIVERGQAPARGASQLLRWSSAENLLLEDMSFFTDHQVGDTRMPWGTRQQAEYRAQAHALRPPASNGGGNETAAPHGPIYYAALAPAYLLASSSPLDQLTLMRLTSALIGALTVLFAFLLARELAPGRPWLAVLAALLVAYEPMYGFISGAVNNDVGVNAGAAALELMLIVLLRRGLTLRAAALTGALLLALPVVKGTAYSLYPLAAIALVATLVRHHRRPDLVGVACFAAAGAAVRALAQALSGAFSPPGVNAAAPAEAGSVVGSATSAALEHPLGYLAYVWQVFLPRLSFMAPHFESTSFPAFVIFVERGWAAFGWYDVLFPHWVYVVILWSMLAALALGLVALRREWSFVRRNVLELIIIVLIPVAVILGVEAAFYTIGVRSVVPEFGRYAFPAIAPLAVLVVASLHAFGRRFVLHAGVALTVAMIALCYASQLLTLTAFYA